eukprot:scaffold8084_cov58-Cyclotella_meneghiniana.AAC.1
MDDFDRKFQSQLLFNFAQKRASKNKLDQQSRASRSASLDDFEYNNDAYHVNTTNFQELSRYILEDLLKCGVGMKFLLCLPVKSGSTYEIDLQTVAFEQREQGVGGDICKISGRDYFCLKVSIDFAPNHEVLGLGMSESQFETLFNNKSGGFRVCFAHTEVKLMFKWYDIVALIWCPKFASAPVFVSECYTREIVSVCQGTSCPPCGSTTTNHVDI